MFKTALFLLSALSLAACTTTDEPNPSPELKVAGKAEHSIKDFTVDEATGAVTFAVEVVYFEFDTYTLTDAGIQQLSVLSGYLKQNANKTLTIEGHADNRGSNEYNLALGQSRAYAVHRFLTDTGVHAARLKTLSFGEERPAQEATSEEAWAKNRRCEFSIVDNAKLEAKEKTASN